MAELPQGDDWKEGTEENLSNIEQCYCPNCGGGNAVTHMLPTKVPLFREIVVMSLYCDDCGFRNSEVSFGGEIQERGQRLCFRVTDPKMDLNRQLIKSDSASLEIPLLQLEIPSATQRGTISTVEGVLRRAAENLQAQQSQRLLLGDVDNFHRCRAVIRRLLVLANANHDEEEKDDDDDEEEEEEAFKSFQPFDIILDDPAGNSFIENVHAPAEDPHMTTEHYYRSPTQDMALGLQPSRQAREDGTIDDSKEAHKNVVNAAPGQHLVQTRTNPTGAETKESAESSLPSNTHLGKVEVMKFPSQCPHCFTPCETDMCVTDIPHFREVIIMSLLCENCGYKSNEIKGSGAIPKYGSLITVKLNRPEDLAREVLKSDTAGVEIPELQLELKEGGLDGLYTTVEGLLHKLHQRLHIANPFASGDSASQQHLTSERTFSAASPSHQRYMDFLRKLQQAAEGKLFPLTLMITDPLSNSFVGPIPADAMALAAEAEKTGTRDCYRDYLDPRMTVEEYERSHEQNEDLGLNDIKTENYQENGVNHGTDQMQDLPDRLVRPDHRGPDHPVPVGKAPVESDTTVMGQGSVQFAVPAMEQRGALKSSEAAPTRVEAEDLLLEIVKAFEYNDEEFIMSDEYDGPIEGRVYKFGTQGLGYYSNVSLDELLEKYQEGKIKLRTTTNLSSLSSSSSSPTTTMTESAPVTASPSPLPSESVTASESPSS